MSDMPLPSLESRLLDIAQRFLNVAGVNKVESIINLGDSEGAREYLQERLAFMWDDEEIDQEFLEAFQEALNALG